MKNLENKNSSLHFLLLFFLVFANTLIYSQNLINLKRTIHLEHVNLEYSSNSCDYELLLPAYRIGKQEVLEYKYSVEPNSIIKTNRSEYIAKWKNISFSELKKTSIDVNMIIRIKKYDLNTAKFKSIIDTANLDTLNYLIEERNFQIKSKNIVKVANTLIGSTREEITNSIFDYVIGHLEYYNYIDVDRGAKKALKQGKGDCTEYSELMVTLCRTKQIPAKIIKGLTIKKGGEVGRHNWVEVYFPQYGWVAFDPTWADYPNSSTTFYSMKNLYIELSDRRWIDPVACSCNNRNNDFLYTLKDSCNDLLSVKYARMKKLYNNEKSKDVILLIDSLLKLTPKNYNLWLHKGISLARLNDFDSSVKCLQEALLNVSSQLEKAYVIYGFANYYALKGEAEQAISYLKESIKLGVIPNKKLMDDNDFNKIKDNPNYIELQKQLNEQTINE